MTNGNGAPLASSSAASSTSAVRGYLMPIGGAEDKIAQRVILTRFVELSGGRSANIVVIPAASAFEVESGKRYCEIFIELGVKSAQYLLLSSRAQANTPTALNRLDDATGIFITGGDQVKLVALLGGTKLAARLREVYQGGATVAGTSAGASALSQVMIAFGRSGATPSQRMVQLASGLGLSSQVIIDQHFRQRDRLGRLMTAVAYNPGELGIGIDEDTAFLIAPDGICEVIGAEGVTIVDGIDLEHSDIHIAQRHDSIAMLGMKVHILTDGYRYDLNQRRVLRPLSLLQVDPDEDSSLDS